MCSCVQLLLPLMVEFMLNEPQTGSRKSSGWRHAASPLGRGGTPPLSSHFPPNCRQVTWRRVKRSSSRPLPPPSSRGTICSDVQFHYSRSSHFLWAQMASLLFYMKSREGGVRGWGVVRARPGECWWAARLFGPVRRPCLVKRCQSEWRAGADARPAGAVMQEGSHVESGLANGKWVTPSWAESAAWPPTLLPSLAASVCSLRAALARRVPIIQSCQMNRARRMAIAFYYEDKRQCGIHDNCWSAPFSPIPPTHTHTHRHDVNRKMIKLHEISPAWMWKRGPLAASLLSHSYNDSLSFYQISLQSFMPDV